MTDPRPVKTIKVPYLYKTAGKFLKKIKEEGVSLKTLLYSSRVSINLKAVAGLVLKCVSHYENVEQLLQKTKILEKEKLNPWLTRILITELIWGKKKLSSSSPRILAVWAYKLELEKHAEANDFQKETRVQKKPRCIRVNTLITTVREVIAQFVDDGYTLLETPKEYDDFLETVKSLNGKSFIVDINIPELLIFNPNEGFYEKELWVNKSIILQDKASCLAVQALSPPPNSIVLDMCAAPGIKTSYIAALIKNEGTIFAIDYHQQRFKTMMQIITDLNASQCVQPLCQDALEYVNEDVEYILVDAPCTGSGIYSNLDNRQFEYSCKDKIRQEKLRGLQAKLLKHALTKFPSAKRVVYSTCSINWMENEGVIDDILKSKMCMSNFKLVNVRKFLKSSLGTLPKSNAHEQFEFSRKCYHLGLDSHMTNGFFIALFKRCHKEGNEVLKNDEPVPEPKIANVNISVIRKKRKKLKNKINTDIITLENEKNPVMVNCENEKEVSLDNKTKQLGEEINKKNKKGRKRKKSIGMEEKNQMVPDVMTAEKSVKENIGKKKMKKKKISRGLSI